MSAADKFWCRAISRSYAGTSHAAEAARQNMRFDSESSATIFRSPRREIQENRDYYLCTLTKIWPWIARYWPTLVCNQTGEGNATHVMLRRSPHTTVEMYQMH